jgi:carbamoyltransferase
VTAILGINAWHSDSAACLLVDGVLVAAVEEERFRRVKHWAGFPSEAIRYCLECAGMDLSGVDRVAVNSDPRANLLRKAQYALVQRPSPGLLWERIRERSVRSSILDELAAAFPDGAFRGELHKVEHHAAHLASAYLVSPFEDAAVLSVDGFGDFASAAWGRGRGGALSVEGRVLFPHSLGIFYMALTQYLGFPHWGDEYKVMGLAPYGEPRFLREMRELVRLRDDGTFRLELGYFRHHRQRTQEWPGSAPHVDAVFSSRLEALLGPRRALDEELTQRHKDIARSTQAMYEEAFFHLVASVQKASGSRNLALAGGCAMNSVANGKVRERSGFERLYVQAAPGDAGGALGAALAIWAAEAGGGTRPRMEHAFLGPEYSHADIGRCIADHAGALAAAGCTVREVPDDGSLTALAARLVSEGKVVGWFQGRAEWGPRALGNRSIVCDPRRADMKEILNRKIKRRESFRPFAPSILRHAVAEWFEGEADVPFMTQVLPIRAGRRERIPAVTHVDGTGRLQTVTREANPRYFALIESFERITGVPMVLNTSFNENEPIVNRPQEALDCFLRTRMDALVLGNWLLARAP